MSAAASIWSVLASALGYALGGGLIAWGLRGLLADRAAALHEQDAVERIATVRKKAVESVQRSLGGELDSLRDELRRERERSAAATAAAAAAAAAAAPARAQTTAFAAAPASLAPPGAQPAHPAPAHPEPACPEPAPPVCGADDAKPSAEPASAAVMPADSPATDDDLTRVKGIGPKLQEALYAFGIRRFDQLASWTEADLRTFLAAHARFKGRVNREAWAHEAARLCAKKASMPVEAGERSARETAPA